MDQPPLELTTELERWPLRTPFRIAGRTWGSLEVLVVTLERDGRRGRGEAAGVFYRQETARSILKEVEGLQKRVEAGIDRVGLKKLLPPGGARNALDCALWDLEARLAERPAWQLAGLEAPRALLTTYTCGADTPEMMAQTAIGYREARAIKVKLLGDGLDAERVRAVRGARPEVWLGVDANQALNRVSLERLLPALTDADVKLIEQPFPLGQEMLLDGFRSPIPVAADESVQCLADIAGLADRFQVINIKLDKCGGLTEGLEMARKAREHGLETMVGNMLGTSLAMAPAYLVGQLCRIVDLDGPIFLKSDRSIAARYQDGKIVCPADLWG